MLVLFEFNCFMRRYWGIDGGPVLSVWLALDDSLKENGALLVIPGATATHLHFMPSIAVPKGHLYIKATTCPLKASLTLSKDY